MTFKAAVPTWEARYEELKEVSAVGTSPLRPGVRFYVGEQSPIPGRISLRWPTSVGNALSGH